MGLKYWIDRKCLKENVHEVCLSTMGYCQWPCFFIVSQRRTKGAPKAIDHALTRWWAHKSPSLKGRANEVNLAKE